MVILEFPLSHNLYLQNTKARYQAKKEKLENLRAQKEALQKEAQRLGVLQ